MNENKKGCKVITVCVQKGGVGKTVSSISISAVLAELGYKVLLIDNDPQADSSKGVGIHKPDGMQITIATIIDDIVHFRSFPKDKGIIHTEEGFDIMPCDNTYSGIEMQLKPHTNKTVGHWETIQRTAKSLSENNMYNKIYVNKGLSNEIPNAKPNRRPDIMAVRTDGIIDQFEIPSKSDNISNLRIRMNDTSNNILKERSGKNHIIYIDRSIH